MKIAIPVFQTKISPRFDRAQNFLLLDIVEDRVVDREELITHGWTPAATIKELLHRSVHGMICGGIDRDSMRRLHRSGVRVYSWVTGEVEDAVASYLSHGLESGIILGARGSRKERWRFRAERNRYRPQDNGHPTHSGEEVKHMPRGDGTGPRGKGPRAGKNRGGRRDGKGRQGVENREGRQPDGNKPAAGGGRNRKTR